MNSPRISAIDDALQQFINQNEMAGAVSLVADANRILHFSAIGLANVEHNEPMRTDKMFWIASMTKPITAAALMMLVDEGRVSIDEPVEKYIPEFAKLKSSSGQPANITLRLCLTHTSGLQEVPKPKRHAAKTLSDLVPAFLDRPTLFKPGTKWQYGQSGIMTAGRIIEIVSGMSFADFLQKRLFDPLGMNETMFYPTMEQAKRIATPYKRVQGTLKPDTYDAFMGKAITDRDRYAPPHMGLFSTTADYLKFDRMILRGGDGLLKADTIREMSSIQTGGLEVGFTPGNGWGLGFCVVREPQGVTAQLSPGTFGHGGAYSTHAWIDPIRERIYLLMMQRSDLPNPDDSEFRRVFYEAAAHT